MDARQNNGSCAWRLVYAVPSFFAGIGLTLLLGALAGSWARKSTRTNAKTR